MMIVVAGRIPKACIGILCKANSTSSREMSCWSAHLTVQDWIRKFLPVIYNPCNLSRSAFSHGKFFITIIINNDRIHSGPKRRENQERRHWWFRILKGRNRRCWGEWWSELLLLMVEILLVELEVLMKAFTRFFFNQLIKNDCGFSFLYLNLFF